MWLNRFKHQSGLDFECASFSEFALSSGGFTEDVLAVVAGDNSLGMAEDDGSLVATSAFHIHEVGVGSGNEALKLVGLSFFLKGGVEEVSVHFMVILTNI